MTRKYAIWCFIFVSIVGTLGHFLYEWSNYNPIVGLFFPVNESTWEHMKLLFFPSILYYILLRLFLNHSFSFQMRCGLLFGTFVGLITIPVLFYTYSGILGFTITFVDIAIFYLAVALESWCFYQIGMECYECSKFQFFTLIALTIILDRKSVV